MASIRKRRWDSAGTSKEAWVLTYTDEEGTRRQRSFEWKRDAERERVRIETEVSEGRHVARASTVTVRQLCEEFIADAEIRLSDGRIGRGRLQMLRATVTHHIVPHVGNLVLTALTPRLVEDLYRKILTSGIKPNTARQRLKAFGAMERFAARRGYMKDRPVRQALSELPSFMPETIRTFTMDEVRTVLGAIDIPTAKTRRRGVLLLRCFVHAAAFCGLRYGEIAALRFDSLDLDRGIVRIRHSLDATTRQLKAPKTKASRRDVPLPDHLVAMLREWVTDHAFPNERGLLFLSTRGTPMTESNFRAGYWLPLLAKADLRNPKDEFHFHALRHFAASLMIANRLPVTEVASLLGHAKFDMTLQTYAHPLVGGHHRRAAVQAMSSRLLAAIPASSAAATRIQTRQIRDTTP